MQAQSDGHTLPAINRAPLRFSLNGPLIPEAINLDRAGKIAGMEHHIRLSQRWLSSQHRLEHAFFNSLERL